MDPVSVRVHVAGNEVDRLALLAFKAQITGDPFGALNLWNEFVHFWYGTGNEVMTLEMFTRKRPTDNMFNDNPSLHNFVMMALPEQALLIQHYFNEEKLGRQAQALLPRDQPAINHVVTQLHVIKNNFLGTDGFMEEEELELQCDHE
ncbi:hypothetical protein TEA_020612 [Camellia sinensis var. sinensis]|uniref:Leucine-rich repeat-containing N-terminal plant-type domain-containing protein n=1 Tax=Camellia sinensis var. sinensis TaxID=542762 RepID=A0A4S4EJJ0_CAMSN|nr:hypothetical protein TEA_020612 [Camellia sinensis var. sinensis]